MYSVRRSSRFQGNHAIMNMLVILNDSPYSSQRSYNGLRLALSLAKSSETSMNVFLFGDGVICGLREPAPMNAFYNVQELLNGLAQRGARIGACKTCLEQRGIGDSMLLAPVKRSTLEDLTTWTEEADKLLTF
jgi:uncharacterized protein involved in oxidation of intracellular sulfur